MTFAFSDQGSALNSQNEDSLLHRKVHDYRIVQQNPFGGT